MSQNTDEDMKKGITSPNFKSQQLEEVERDAVVASAKQFAQQVSSAPDDSKRVAERNQGDSSERVNPNDPVKELEKGKLPESSQVFPTPEVPATKEPAELFDKGSQAKTAVKTETQNSSTRVEEKGKN